jgi:GWxTD domain-containing protein
MNRTKVFLTAIAVSAMAVSGFAALSQKYAEFGSGPAQYLMTKDELSKWKSIKDDAAAQAFIDLFWARRDPSPGTPENETQEAFDAKVKYADEHFAHGKFKGSQTDRGKVFIVLGSPSRIQRTSPEPKSTIQTPNDAFGVPKEGENASVQGYSPKQVWFYDPTKTKTPIGSQTAEIVFIDQYGSEDWKLDRTPRTDYIGLLARVNEAMIAQPGLSVAPTYAAAAVPAPAVAMSIPTPAAAPAATTPATFTTDAYRAAIDEYRAAKQSPYKNVYVTYAENVTTSGEDFVPLQIFVPKTAGLNADDSYVFFGQVDDAAGKTAAIYEEPAKLVASKDDLFFARSLTLPPGKYRGTFGLAQNGKPVTMVATDINVTGLDKAAPGVSNLILSNNVYPLTEAQKPTDPFAFGGIKVVPKSDATFTQADELWYFFEARNPGLDPTTKQPKLRAKLTVEGKSTEGKAVKYDNPPMDLEPQELKGVEGHWAVGQSIPLSGFKPGDYTMKMKITDTVNNQVYEQSQPFKVVKQ